MQKKIVNPYIILIDIGNTNTIIGISKPNNDLNEVQSFRFTTNKNSTVDDFAILLNFAILNSKIKNTQIISSIISSVVPELDNIVKDSILKYIKSETIFISEKTIKNIIKINYKNPQEIGADRIINSIAAIHLYKKPLMIVDIGTAATIDIINNKKEYIGGAILPGIGLSLLSLSKMTSKLPKIKIEAVKNMIGTNTYESIQSGLYNGFLGSIFYFKKELSEKQSTKNLKTILTGGYTNIYKKETSIFDIHDINLTLKGLKIVYLQLKK